MPKHLQRKCKCECGNEWTDVQILYGREKPEDPLCSQCSGNTAQLVPHKNGIEDIIASRQSPAVGSRAASRAGDFCGRMLEEDYGIPPSMIRDTGVKPGDTYVKSPRPQAPAAQYLSSGDTSKEIASSFLASAKASGGLGENNLNGFEIVQSGIKSGAINNPLKSSTFISAKD